MARKKPPFDLKTALHEARTKRNFAGERDMFLFWTIANEQVDTLKDPAGGKRTLREGLKCAESVADILVIASAWRCHFQLDGGYADLLRTA